MATAVREVIEQGGTPMPQSGAIPRPETEFTNGGKILDDHGHTVPPAKSKTFMGRFNKAASEPITLSRGTIWLLATALVLAGVVFSYGGSIIGWARSDEAVRVNQGVMQNDIQEMRQDMKEMKEQFTALQKTLQEQAVKDAEMKGRTTGFQLGVAEAETAQKGRK